MDADSSPIYSERFTADLQRNQLAKDPAELGCQQTQKIYDLVAPLYSASTMLFHSRAHAAALAASGVLNSTKTLEVAIGSGEMFQRLIGANPDGATVGIDLSPQMAAKSQAAARRRFPKATAYCQSADARHLPFSKGFFDAVMCCYLFELLPEDQAPSAMAELARALRPGGRLTIVLVAQNKPVFNTLYRVCANLAPAFWGRQVEQQVVSLLASHGFTLQEDRYVGQLFYSSRILSATAASEK